MKYQFKFYLTKLNLLEKEKLTFKEDCITKRVNYSLNIVVWSCISSQRLIVCTNRGENGAGSIHKDSGDKGSGFIL